jgi:isoaspartyl peptidase/L-asparaginase-like protein (Ntn-hydrolase superfamily)
VKNIAKKIIIYSMVGIMQVGLGASVIEASPRHNDNRYEHRYESRDHRIHAEMERHEREMARRDREEEWQWRERQEREKEHHEEVMRTIGGLALLYLLTNNN